MESNIINIIKTFSAVLGGVIGAIFGELDGAMIALLAFITIDYITGLMVGITSKTLNSAVGFKGLAKKVFILLLVLIANVLDTHVMGGSGVVRGLVIAFYIANEGLSILENAGKLGVPYPEKLRNVLEQLKEKNEGGQDADKL